MVTEKKLRDLKRRYSLELMNLKGVSGVGIEKDESGNFVLAIHLSSATPETLNLPDELNDLPIKYLHQGGGFRKRPADSQK